MSIPVDVIFKVFEKLGGWYRFRKAKKLSDLEKEMLYLAADNEGEIHKLKIDQIGEFVRTGKKDHHNANDPSVAAQGVDALRRLIKLGLVRHESDALYVLSGEGWKRACEKRTGR